LTEGNTGTVFVSSGNGLASCAFLGFWLFGAVVEDDGLSGDEGFAGACAASWNAAIPKPHTVASAPQKRRFNPIFLRCSIIPSMLGCEA
jgi:hypothetical protein